MRHLKRGRKLGRNSSHREAMYRNMVTSLMEHGRIKTTEAKAKELRRYAERVITLSRRVPPSTLEGLDEASKKAATAKRIHAIRQARHWVRNPDALNKLFTEYSELFKDRPGGYTRIYKLGRRTGDNAPMAIIELVTEPYEPGAKAPAEVATSEAPAEEAPAEEAPAEEAPAETAPADAPAEAEADVDAGSEDDAPEAGEE